MKRHAANIHHIQLPTITYQIERCRLTPGLPRLVAAIGAKREELLSNFAFNFNLRPSSMAAQDGHLDVVELLIAAPGVNINQSCTDDGATPLSAAHANGHPRVAAMLRAAGTD